MKRLLSLAIVAAFAACDGSQPLVAPESTQPSFASSSTPSPRYGAAIAELDANTVVLFGGYDGTKTLDVAWLWDGTDLRKGKAK